MTLEEPEPRLSLACPAREIENQRLPTCMPDCTRREFAETILKSLTLYSFVGTAISSQAMDSALRIEARVWSAQINEISINLRARRLTPINWQEAVEGVLGNIDLPELLTRIDLAKFQRSLNAPDGGAASKELDFRKVLGMPDGLRYNTAIFGMRKGRSIVPHGHHNVVSGHLVIKGNLHVRNYERLGDEDDTLIIRPTIDKIISVRDCSTQSSSRNNIHWFTAVSSTAFTFDVIVQYLDPDQPCGRDYVDPLHAQKLSDGSLRVRRLQQDDAENMYGGSDHH
jgi:hypothetical protein